MQVKSQFINVMQAVKSWAITKCTGKKYNDINFEIIKDDEDGFCLRFESKKCIGEIVVCCEDFVPYRFVKMEILSTCDILNNPVFVWFDSEGDDRDSIISNLERGIDFAMNY